MEEKKEGTRVGIVSLIIETDYEESIRRINEVLHEYRAYVLCRLGYPMADKGMNLICLPVEGPMDRLNRLVGTLGRLDGVTAKITCAPEKN
ncbi:MAG: iron-only hydrogenase system regulator [Clostridia bacterium]|nr:iron-only hydrogenase system regulator [Clostridia bacterium]